MEGGRYREGGREREREIERGRERDIEGGREREREGDRRREGERDRGRRERERREGREGGEKRERSDTHVMNSSSSSLSLPPFHSSYITTKMQDIPLVFPPPTLRCLRYCAAEVMTNDMQFCIVQLH